MSTLNFTQFATFGDFAQFWLATKVDTKPTTQACYRSLLQCAAARFADMPITQIERADIMRWIVDLIEQREYDAGQVRAAHRVVHSTLALARCLGAIESNPATEITLPRIRNHSPRLDRRLAVPELESLAQQIGWWKLVPVHEVSLGLSGAFSRSGSTRDTGLGEGGGVPFHEAPSGIGGCAPDGESSRDMGVAPHEPRVVETFCGGETPPVHPGRTAPGTRFPHPPEQTVAGFQPAVSLCDGGGGHRGNWAAYSRFAPHGGVAGGERGGECQGSGPDAGAFQRRDDPGCVCGLVCRGLERRGRRAGRIAAPRGLLAHITPPSQREAVKSGHDWQL
ncbi:hypothetical protein [Mobiluncus mulieris]|uniref:hypothetical protein n=1 Tax=Mobiluncus mulieris TaxID=2052 RepID=UPI003C6CFF57